MREAGSQISRENYLAVALLICLGCRKMELLAAPWCEFDLEGATWTLPKDRTKTKERGLVIPLPPAVVAWLRELHVRACGSPYVFPARKKSKRYQHMGPDTLNFALKKLIEGKDIEDFSVHSLRHSCRTLLASMGVSPEVAKRCLNHKLTGMDAIYNNHDYLAERKQALTTLAELIQPLVDVTQSSSSICTSPEEFPITNGPKVHENGHGTHPAEGRYVAYELENFP